MSQHRVFCQPVSLRKLGYEIKPYGVVLSSNVEKMNQFFGEIDEKYDAAKKEAKKSNQRVPDGYEYLVRRGSGYFCSVEDKIFNKIENSHLDGVSFPDMDPPAKVE